MFITTGTLTGDIKKPETSIGAYLRTTFPNTKHLQDWIKENTGPLLVEGEQRTSSLVGTATDIIVALLLAPGEAPASSRLLFPFNTGYHEVVGELARLVTEDRDIEVQARAAYALAETVAAYRAGAWGAEMKGRILEGDFTVEAALEDAPRNAVVELIQLRQLAIGRLLPRLNPPYVHGATFDLTHVGPEQRLAAEADLIAGGLLIDVKTTMGAKLKNGTRPNTVRPDALHQLVAYALLDHSDAYSIDHVGIYSARYGHTHVFILQELLDTLAGVDDFDIDAAKETLYGLMQREHEFIAR